ncbi:Hypp9467 [Branchiostoma lanceolatum]|uniref:Hypp9467 protein n=1 Tax=Branchiostoma lanceolatum TaxID=7740 RepID=A0A8S4MMI5_BRALA|nr:Hypp9467 [Branchiostoma lanceolatum]
MYEEAQPVRAPRKGPDSGQRSGQSSDSRPIQHSGSSGPWQRRSDLHGKDADDKLEEGLEETSHTNEEAEAVKRNAVYRSTDMFWWVAVIIIIMSGGLPGLSPPFLPSRYGPPWVAAGKAAGTFKRGLFKRGSERKQKPTAADATGAQTPTEYVTGAQTPTEDDTSAQTPNEDVTGAQTPTEDVTGAQTPTEDVTGAQTLVADVTGGQKAQTFDGVQVAWGRVLRDPYDTEDQDVLEVLLLEMSKTDWAAVFKDEMVSIWSRDNGRFLKECQEGQLVTWLKGEVKKKHPISRAPTSKRYRKNQKDKVDKPKTTKKDKAKAPKKTRKEHQQSLPKML